MNIPKLINFRRREKTRFPYPFCEPLNLNRLIVCEAFNYSIRIELVCLGNFTMSFIREVWLQAFRSRFF